VIAVKPVVEPFKLCRAKSLEMRTLAGKGQIASTITIAVKAATPALLQSQSRRQLQEEDKTQG